MIYKEKLELFNCAEAKEENLSGPGEAGSGRSEVGWTWESVRGGDEGSKFGTKDFKVGGGQR